MTRKQIAFIIGLNAVISVVISVVVALIFIQPDQDAPPSAATTSPGPATTSQVMATEAPTDELVVHTVTSGDTISGLAFQYDVP